MKRKFYYLLFIIGLLGYIACQKTIPTKTVSSKTVNTPTKTNPFWSPRYRIHPSPSNGELAISNPPILKIPVKKGSKKYSFRLANNAEFAGNSLQQVGNIPFALYNPHQALAPGKWFWQYKYSTDDWSATQQFEITDQVPVFVTPTAKELLTKIPTTRPRVLVYQKDLAAFRERNKEAIDAKNYIKLAEQALTITPPDESLGIPTIKGNTAI